MQHQHVSESLTIVPLTLMGGPGAATIWGAPPTEHFLKVWDHLSRGGRGAIDGVGGVKHVSKLAWCLYETLRRADAKLTLRTADFVLARDARK